MISTRVNAKNGCTVQTIKQGKLIEINSVNTGFLCFREDSSGYPVVGIVK